MTKANAGSLKGFRRKKKMSNYWTTLGEWREFRVAPLNCHPSIYTCMDIICIIQILSGLQWPLEKLNSFTKSYVLTDMKLEINIIYNNNLVKYNTVEKANVHSQITVSSHMTVYLETGVSLQPWLCMSLLTVACYNSVLMPVCVPVVLAPCLCFPLRAGGSLERSHANMVLQNAYPPSPNMIWVHKRKWCSASLPPSPSPYPSPLRVSAVALLPRALSPGFAAVFSPTPSVSPCDYCGM